MRFLEVKIDGAIHGYAEDCARGRESADKCVWQRMAAGATSATVTPAGRRIPQGARRVDR